MRQKPQPLNVVFAIVDGEVSPEAVCSVDEMDTDHTVNLVKETMGGTVWLARYLPATSILRVRENLEFEIQRCLEPSALPALKSILRQLDALVTDPWPEGAET